MKKYNYEVKMIFKGKVKAESEKDALGRLNLMGNIGFLDYHETKYNVDVIDDES